MTHCKKELTEPSIYNEKKTGDNFWLFENTTPGQAFKHPRDCVDTINARCESKNLEDCIETCAKSPRCSFGYHVSDGENHHCLPIYTSDFYPESNPLYALQNKDCYEITKGGNISATSFVNSERWIKDNKLPDEANSVWMEDKVKLKSGSGLYLLMKPGLAKMVKNEGTAVKILSESTFGFGSYVAKLLDKVDFGSHVSFTLGDEKSSLVLEKTPQGISAKEHLNWLQTAQQSFKIVKIEKGSRNFLVYEEEFAITMDNGLTFLYVSKDGNLANKTLKNFQFDNKNSSITCFSTHCNVPEEFKFSLIPTKTVYYCDKNSCQSIKLSDTKTNEGQARVGKSVVYLSDNCFGKCSWSQDPVNVPLKKHDEFVENNHICLILTIFLVLLASLTFLI